MSPRAVVVGLDGAAWHLLDPMIDDGVMPHLAALREGAAWGTLTSTVPTYTPPAWTSAVTGVNPGRHGIYGFHATHAQHDRPRLMHCGAVKSPTLWEIANAQGAGVGMYNLPLTYPPQKVDPGWMVSGMMTPSHGQRVSGFTFPASLEREILSRVPDYEIDLRTSYEDDWRDDSLCRRALTSLRQRRSVLEYLVEKHSVDVLFTVIETPDRLQHAYYRSMDPRDPVYQSETVQRLRPAIAECFSAIDDVVGVLVEYAGADGAVVVCSDHGFTAWDVSVHTNALLEKWGYLKIKSAAKFMQSRAARALVPVAKKFLSPRRASLAKTRTFAAIDWSRTSAFASPIPQQGIFLNLAGREPFGIVPGEDAVSLKQEIAQRFLELDGPDGAPVTDLVHLSEDVFSGEALDGAPDLLPVLRDHTFELDDEVFHKEPFTDVTGLPRGVHHPTGIVAYLGEGVRRRPGISGTILEITPTLLYMAGLKVPEGLDGRVAEAAFDPAHLESHPIGTTKPLPARRGDRTSPYSPQEEKQVEQVLRDLGYL